MDDITNKRIARFLANKKGTNEGRRIVQKAINTTGRHKSIENHLTEFVHGNPALDILKKYEYQVITNLGKPFITNNSHHRTNIEKVQKAINIITEPKRRNNFFKKIIFSNQPNINTALDILKKAEKAAVEKAAVEKAATEKAAAEKAAKAVAAKVAT